MVASPLRIFTKWNKRFQEKSSKSLQKISGTFVTFYRGIGIFSDAPEITLLRLTFKAGSHVRFLAFVLVLASLRRTCEPALSNIQIKAELRG